MKALKTPLAKVVLADPKAKDQLRTFMASRGAQAVVIEVRAQGKTRRVTPIIVPKATA
ncbi:MAG: hypothetical protein ACLGII_08315 [Gammaproteobacteria bacterium]|jgi:hypothetical protein